MGQKKIPLGTKGRTSILSYREYVRPAELHSRSAEKNCLTENVSSLRSVKGATLPYGFVNKCEMVDFAGYTAYWCENHLYLINPELSEEAIKALVEKYNTEGTFNPQNIVLFGYSFNYVEMENLKTNVKILRDSEKNLKINLDVRY